MVTKGEDVRIVVQSAFAQLVKHKAEHVVPTCDHAEIHRAHLIVLGLSPALHILTLSNGTQDARLAIKRLDIGAARRQRRTVDERIPRLLAAIRGMRERERTVDEERLLLLLGVDGIQEGQGGIHAIPIEIMVK